MASDHILHDKRAYNQWVASETMEDYALRYTAISARRWSAGRVAGTAMGACAFLVCEAIGAGITFNFGFANAVAAIGFTVAIMFVLGLPIAAHAARYGLDIDLLTRGGGFGYIGSTLTSLIYASFTFLLFAIEALIMARALEEMLGLALPLAYLACALLVMPVAIYGMRAITGFQHGTQVIWAALQLAPVVWLIHAGGPMMRGWTSFAGLDGGHGGLALAPFGLAVSTLLSLLPQIGEQADYLRFTPPVEQVGRARWWSAVLAAGPGWSLIAGAKLLLGCALGWLLIQSHGQAHATYSPFVMFQNVFVHMVGDARVGLALTGLLVIVAQMKINVTNAYAGSIAWSNFFARLTHSHPGRAIWIVFNVVVALLLMELGVMGMIAAVLPIYASIAAGWIGALSADLMVSKPLGLSPRGIEFKRAHLYDINPVGVGAMALSILASLLAHGGALGETAQAFAPLIGLAVAFAAAPLLAWLSRGRFYLARQAQDTDFSTQKGGLQNCIICENAFEAPDMAHCPMHKGPICSLCCTLEARCHDRCKTRARISEQVIDAVSALMPRELSDKVNTSFGQFLIVMVVLSGVMTGIVGAVYWEMTQRVMAESIPAVRAILGVTLVLLLLLGGVLGWLIVLAHESRRAALAEADHHVASLEAEVAAHNITLEELHQAKEAAEAANSAKSRYLVSVSHEIRSPLNSIYGYAQLMERGHDIAPIEAARIIRRSSEHLTNLVEGLLDISHVESGVLRLSNDTVRLKSFLDQIASMFRPQAQSRGLKLVYETQGRLPEFVRTDQKRLRQILINLLSNAIKFTKAGQITFSVAYRSQVMSFTIADTGIGIAKPDLEKIFAPFERGTHPEAQRQKGIGLGLAITQALVHILGGDLAVSSEPGVGTTFTVRLMLSPVQASVQEVKSTRAITGYDGPSRSVLLIDDDPDQTSLLRGLLEPLGFTIHAAHDGDKGLALAQKHRPELVLLDVTMPGLSGWEVARRLRAMRGSDIRIIMVSGDAHEIQQGSAGFIAHDQFLIKPVDLDALVDAVGSLLGLHWRGRVEEAEVAEVTPERDTLPDAALPFLSDIESDLRIGHVRGVEKSVRAMEAAVPQAAPLARRLLACLDNFDLHGLAAELAAERKGASPGAAAGGESR